MPIFKVNRYSLGDAKNSIGAGLTAVPVSNQVSQSGLAVYTLSGSGSSPASGKKSQTPAEPYTREQELISQVKADSHYRKRKRQVEAAVVPGKGTVHISISKTDMSVLNQMKRRNAEMK